jgi:hypothetical protein
MDVPPLGARRTGDESRRLYARDGRRAIGKKVEGTREDP